MDEQRPDGAPRRYDETTHAKNPPNSVLHKDARRAAVWSYFVPIVVLFVVIGVALLYWANRPAHSGTDNPRRAEVGTVGSTEGGFDPQDTPRPDSTREEIQRRGGDLAPATSLGDLRGVNARTAAGRRVTLSDVEVDGADGSLIWLRDGDQRYAVVANNGAPAVRKGATVDVSGHIEPDASGRLQIRADRITQK